jgi:hypothetical protein
MCLSFIGHTALLTTLMVSVALQATVRQLYSVIPLSVSDHVVLAFSLEAEVRIGLVASPRCSPLLTQQPTTSIIKSISKVSNFRSKSSPCLSIGSSRAIIVDHRPPDAMAALG